MEEVVGDPDKQSRESRGRTTDSGSVVSIGVISGAQARGERFVGRRPVCGLVVQLVRTLPERQRGSIAIASHEPTCQGKSGTLQVTADLCEILAE